MKKFSNILLLLLIVATLAACAPTSQAALPAPSAVPSNPALNVLPQTDADVPRVKPAEAKAALERGEAIIVDVRGVEDYTAKHISGALFIPLTTIMASPTNLDLDKNLWIITYCT